LGASPGMHYSSLASMFPTLKFFSFDPQPFLASSGIIHIPWSENPDMDVVYQSLVDVSWRAKPSVLVISDIWVSSFMHTQGLVDTYVDLIAQKNNVVAVMEKQFVDFSVPSTSVRARGERFGQLYLGGKSGEVRSVTYGNDLTTALMDSDVLEKKINCFRSVVRKYARVEIDGVDYCFQCGNENLIMDLVISRVGKDVTALFNDVRDKKLIHPALGILKGAKTYEGLKTKYKKNKGDYTYTTTMVKGDYYMPGGKVVKRGNNQDNVMKWKFKYSISDTGIGDVCLSVKGYDDVYISRFFFYLQ